MEEKKRKKHNSFPYIIKDFNMHISRYKFREKEERIFFRDMCVEYMANFFGRYSYRCSL